MSQRVLYGYWRSSAAYRVRIALNLKELEYQNKSVHLVREGGEQHQPAFQALNASALVPVLVDDAITLNQSLAILQYLDERYSQAPLLPPFSALRYQAIALAQDIAIDIHPLNNLRVLQYLEGVYESDMDAKKAWMHHWLHKGFSALEIKLKTHRQQYGDCRYSLGDSPGIVDVCLVPQVYNAHRFGLEMSAYPLINSIVEACNQLSAFIEAMPENQPDAC